MVKLVIVVSTLCSLSMFLGCDGSPEDPTSQSTNTANDEIKAEGVTSAQDTNDSTSVDDDTTKQVDTTPEHNDATAVQTCSLPEEWTEAATSGLVYLDNDNSSTSTYDDQFDPRIDAPLKGIIVHLLGPDGFMDAVETCDDGVYGFDQLTEGVYIVEFGIEDSEFTTKNRARYFPAALRKGDVHIITIGDSVPKVGDKPFFPERLGNLLSQFGKITNDNIAIPGTTSEHWLPGTFNFNKELAPRLPTADVVIISLGGNDVLQYVQENAQDLSGIAAALENFPKFVQEIRERVLTIANAIRQVNPHLDIVYCLYPNYATSDLWNEMLYGFGDLVTGYVTEALSQVRASITPSDNILLVDLFGGTQNVDLDNILYDYLHFNDAGQQLYAEEIFVILGGVRIGDKPLGLVRNVGVATKSD